MKKTNLEAILIIILVICLLAIVAYMGYFSAVTKKDAAQTTTQEQTKESTQDLSTVDKTITSDNSSTNIHIFSPKKGETIGLPLKILGEARVFESTYIVRLKEKGGNILAEESGMTLPGDAGEFNLFNKEMNYPQPKGSDGILEVFQYSAKDGSEIDKVTIPVKFGYVQSMYIKVYFSNSIKDPNTMNCNKVFETTRRVGWAKDTANVALQELLKGPTKDEAKNGFYSSINTGVKLNSVTIKNYTATADFDDMLQAGVGGSCKVSAIRAQITETLKQFGTVKNVVISIGGRTEDILQP
ncbi:MAG TPA: Gmad2 immunoglobulin-like domain-containing protein [Patescibacteria group bacterium]|nr:Gmad2 immunoglobulin-like domain-containing protein [Patescibacteria group bacterium]